MNLNTPLDTSAVTPVVEELIPLKPEGSLDASGLGCLVIVARHHGLHLSVSQLAHDHVLSNKEVSLNEIVDFAKSSGLTAKVVKLAWNDLTQLKKALPAIVHLRNDACMVLLRIEGEGDGTRAI